MNVYAKPDQLGKSPFSPMTTDQDKCGIGSLFPMSCRGRAEAFARRLHSRLRTLGSLGGNQSADESSWLAAHESSIAVSQPRHSSDSDLYFDFGLLESPGSPEEEIAESELEKLLNKDNLKHNTHTENCTCSNPEKPVETKRTHKLDSLRATSNDSDSDGPFYDTENGSDIKLESGYVNGICSSSSETLNNFSEDGKNEISNNQTDDSYASPSEFTAPPNTSSSLSEDASTLSIKDEDYSSLEINGTGIELPQTEEAPINYEHTIDEPDFISPSLQNGVEETNNVNGDVELYTSCLSIDHDFTVECPQNEVSARKSELVEIKIETVPSNGIRENTIIEEDEDDQDEDYERIPRVRRCSSLKTGKTPPGTPGRKKIVRFADVLGLDLADVRTYLDEIPKVPTSAYEDLRDVDLSDSSSSNSLSGASMKFHGIKVEKLLLPLFQQPGGQANFMDRVRDNLVSLENALVEDPVALSITGTVRVRNFDFHKSVHIRYSLDSWKTFADVQAKYVKDSCDGFSDKFSFLIYAHTLSVGQRLEFAVRFQCKGIQYWDSNSGANYVFQCLPASNNQTYQPITTGVDDWGASFY